MNYEIELRTVKFSLTLGLKKLFLINLNESFP